MTTSLKEQLAAKVAANKHQDNTKEATDQPAVEALAGANASIKPKINPTPPAPSKPEVPTGMTEYTCQGECFATALPNGTPIRFINGSYITDNQDIIDYLDMEFGKSSLITKIKYT